MCDSSKPNFKVNQYMETRKKDKEKEIRQEPKKEVLKTSTGGSREQLTVIDVGDGGVSV